MTFSPVRAGLAAAALVVATSLTLAASAFEVKHDLGTTDVPDEPQRIVALEFSFVDSLAAVGVAPVGIADDNERSRIVPAYTDIIGSDWTSVGTRAAPSLEIIASLQPDLIIADTSRHEAIYGALSEIAPTLVFDSLTGKYDVALESARTIASAVGKGAEMEARLVEHEKTMAGFKSEIGDVSDLSIQFIVDNGKGVYLHTPDSYNGSLLAWFGFKSNLNPNGGDSYADVIAQSSLEQLSEVNPEIILRGKYADPGLTDTWAGQPLYDAIAAVSKDQVFDINAHEWSRLRGVLASEVSGASLVEVMKKVAR